MSFIDVPFTIGFTVFRCSTHCLVFNPPFGENSILRFVFAMLTKPKKSLVKGRLKERMTSSSKELIPCFLVLGSCLIKDELSFARLDDMIHQKDPEDIFDY